VGCQKAGRCEEPYHILVWFGVVGYFRNSDCARDIRVLLCLPYDVRFMQKTIAYGCIYRYTLNVQHQLDVEECSDFPLSLIDVDIALTLTDALDRNRVGPILRRDCRQLLLEILLCPAQTILRGPMPDQSKSASAKTSHDN